MTSVAVSEADLSASISSCSPSSFRIPARIVDFKSVSQDPGARNPISASGIENFEFKNHELVKRKSLKIEVCKTVHSLVQNKCSSQICEIEFLKPARSVLSHIDIVAKNWVKGNGLLVGLISKLRSKTIVATTAIEGEADD